MPKGLVLVREDETLVRFVYPSLMYGVIALVGWACAVLVLLYFSGVRRGVFFAMMVLLGGVGTWGGLWREDINLDVSHRRDSLRRGFWPGPDHPSVVIRLSFGSACDRCHCGMSFGSARISKITSGSTSVSTFCVVVRSGI
jgi:hypothetical protein